MRTLLTLGVVALSACAPDGTSPNAVPTASPALAKNAGDTPVLLARAILPSDAYQPGPISGTLITPDNGVTLPFPGQPVPGFSAVLDAGDGTFWAMPDNGYAAKNNSADSLAEIDGALRRYYRNPSGFDVHERTSAPIAFERLDIIPWACRA